MLLFITNIDYYSPRLSFFIGFKKKRKHWCIKEKSEINLFKSFFAFVDNFVTLIKCLWLTAQSRPWVPSIGQNLQPFTDNGDVSIWVKNARVEWLIQNKRTMWTLLELWFSRQPKCTTELKAFGWLLLYVAEVKLLAWGIYSEATELTFWINVMAIYST